MDVLDELTIVALQAGSGATGRGAPPVSKPPIQKLNYSHEGMIDLIIANRGISQNELAARFGYSPSWISTIMQGDAFQDRFRARMAEVLDPTLIATVEEQLKGILARSMEILRKKLDNEPEQIPDNLVLRSVELSSRALGLGVKAPQVTINNVTMENHLDDLGGRLTGLLSRKKTELLEQLPLESQQT